MAQISYNFGFESYAKNLHVNFPSERLVPTPHPVHPAQPHPSVYAIIPPTRPVPHAQPRPSLYGIIPPTNPVPTTRSVPPTNPVLPAEPPLNLKGNSYSELTWIKIDDAARTKLNSLGYTKAKISSWIGKERHAIARAKDISVRNARIIQIRSDKDDLFVFDVDHITQIKFDQAAQKKLIEAIRELNSRGIVLEMVASGLGVSIKTLQSWISGDRSAIITEHAIKVNSYFKKQIDKTIFDLKSVLEAALKEPIEDPQDEVVDAEVVDDE